MKLLVMCLDGMDYHQTTVIPNMEWLLKECDWGSLRSIASQDKNKIIDKEGKIKERQFASPHTGPCFASIYTGEIPKVHGITKGGWLKGDKNWNDLKVPTIFDRIEKHYSMGLMTLPITYPAKKIGKWMISGFPGELNKRAAYNVPLEINKKGVYSIISDEFAIDFSDAHNHRKDTTKERITLKDGTERVQYKIPKGLSRTLYLIEKEKLAVARKLPDVAVLFMGYTLLDKVGHYGTIKNFEEAYVYAGNLIKETIDAFEPENFLICSDHGFNIMDRQHAMQGFWALHPIQKSLVDYELSITDIHSLINDILKLDELDIKQKLGELGYLDTPKPPIIHCEDTKVWWDETKEYRKYRSEKHGTV